MLAAALADQPPRLRVAVERERRPGRGCGRRSRPCSRSARTSAQPPATASTQPVSPQRQTTPSAAGVLVCPISPAAPSAPRWSTAAGDDAGAEAGRGLDQQHVVEAARGARAARRAPSRWRRCRAAPARRCGELAVRYGASATPSQPLMIGESRLRAALVVDRAGDAQPRRRVTSSSRPAGLVEQVRRAVWPAPASARRGPTPTSWSTSARPRAPRRRGRRRRAGCGCGRSAAGEHHAGVGVEARAARAAGRRSTAPSSSSTTRPALEQRGRAAPRPPCGTAR